MQGKEVHPGMFYALTFHCQRQAFQLWVLEMSTGSQNTPMDFTWLQDWYHWKHTKRSEAWQWQQRAFRTQKTKPNPPITNLILPHQNLVLVQLHEPDVFDQVTKTIWKRQIYWRNLSFSPQRSKQPGITLTLAKRENSFQKKSCICNCVVQIYFQGADKMRIYCFHLCTVSIAWKMESMVWRISLVFPIIYFLAFTQCFFIGESRSPFPLALISTTVVS